MELINNHVLFAQPADWKQPPTWSRVWQNQVASAVTGAESRLGVRAQPRVKLEFQIMPAGWLEQVQLNEGILAAKKSGRACAPYHGRGGQLVERAAANTDPKLITDTWPWAAGDFCFFFNGLVGEAHEVESAVLDAGTWTLQLAEALAHSYDSGLLAWPLLFGAFECDELTARTGYVGPARIAITELVAARTAQLGADPVVSGDGIGVWEIGSTFQVQ